MRRTTLLLAFVILPVAVAPSAAQLPANSVELSVAPTLPVLGASPSSAQQGATIRGVVTDVPTEGASVKVDHSGIVPIASTSTSRVFEVFGLPADLPGIELSRLGYGREDYDGFQCRGSCSFSAPAATLSGSATFIANLALQPLASISGTLRDAGSLTPLVGSVGAYSVQGTLLGSAASDATGRYSIYLDPGTYFLAAGASGYRGELHDNIVCIALDCSGVTSGTPIVLTGPGHAATVDFALAQAGAFAGTVRRASDGSGIAGLNVLVYNASTSPLSVVGDPPIARTVRTDVGGTYLVDGLAAGSYFARTAVGFPEPGPGPVDFLTELYGDVLCPMAEPATDCRIASGTPIVVTAGATTAGIDFSLDRGATISGTVVAEGTQAPVASVGVVAYLGDVQFAAGVNASGHYTIVGLAPGTYRLRPTASPIANDRIVTVSAGANVMGIDFSVALAAYGGISGRINLPCVSFPYTSPGAITAPRVQVYTGSGVLAGESAPAFGSFPDCPSFDYTVGGLPAGQYYLLVRDRPAVPFNPRFAATGDLIDELYNDIVCVTADCDVTRGTPVSVTAGTVTGGVDFQMVSGRAISVADATTLNGVPPSHLAIFDVRGVPLVSVERLSWATTTVSFVGLPPGAYFVKKGDTLYPDIACPDCPPTSGVPIIIGPDTPSAALSFGSPPQGRVSGTVRDTGSAGLSTIAVELYTDAGRVAGSAVSDLHGNYSIPSIHPGTYFLRTRNDRGYVDKVFADGPCASCDIRTGTPVVVASARVTGIDFTLAAGGLVSGVVTDTAGVPVGGVRVSVFSPDGVLAEKALASAVGQFRVTLPAGSYRARAEPSVAHGAEVFSEQPCTSAACDVTAGTPIAVTAGTVTSNVTFTLASCSAMTLSPPLLASGVVGRPYRQVYSTSGGTAPYVYRVTEGVLPLGLAGGVSSGVLEGTPTVSGRHAFTVGVVDANGCATARAYTLDVQDCAFSLSPVSATVPAAGGTVTVAIAGACGSQAVSSAAFVTVRSNTVGQVVLDVLANPTAAPRTDDLTIGRRVFTIRQAGVASQPPFGVLDAPADGAQVSGSIAVGGWALDDLEVSRVQIFRDPVGGEPAMPLFIGTAVFVAGARPDVQRAYPTYPLNNRAGWGFLILTNMLPNQGNGTFRIYAYAEDAEGARALLGAKTIVVNNATATLPFGAIDTPGQGETIGGSAYLNWGWALTPQPKIIPTDGSTIQVYVDGVPQGHPIYNLFRPDVAGLFPGLANSGGPVGYRVLDTTALAEGQHTIAWVVTDSQGAANGIGSRYFSVANSADAQALARTSAVTSPDAPGTPVAEPVVSAPAIAVVAGPDHSRRTASLTAAPAIAGPVVALRGEGPARLVQPSDDGKRTFRLRALERLEFGLSDTPLPCAGTWAGYLVDDDKLSDLPVGAAIDPSGTFYWQPGPGFLGTFELLFVRTACDGTKERLPVTVTITNQFPAAEEE